jgi:hypothetical protein
MREGGLSVPLRKAGLSASGTFQVGFGVPDWPGLGPGCPVARLAARVPKGLCHWRRLTSYPGAWQGANISGIIEDVPSRYIPCGRCTVLGHFPPVD